MEFGKSILTIAANEGDQPVRLQVLLLDKVSDIRKITIDNKSPNGETMSLRIEYPVVTKYLVQDISSDRIFTIFVNQIMSIGNPKKSTK
jgi:hypothetical protein